MSEDKQSDKPVKVMRYFTFEELQKIEDGVRNNLTYEEIGKLLGRSRYSIKNEIYRFAKKDEYTARGAWEIREKSILRKNANLFKGNFEVYEEKKSQVGVLLKSGASYAEIRRTVGIGFNTLHRMVNSYPIKERREWAADIRDRFDSLQQQIDILFDLIKEIRNDKANE